MEESALPAGLSVDVPLLLSVFSDWGILGPEANHHFRRESAAHRTRLAINW